VCSACPNIRLARRDACLQSIAEAFFEACVFPTAPKRRENAGKGEKKEKGRIRAREQGEGILSEAENGEELAMPLDELHTHAPS